MKATKPPGPSTEPLVEILIGSVQNPLQNPFQNPSGFSRELIQDFTPYMESVSEKLILKSTCSLSIDLARPLCNLLPSGDSIISCTKVCYGWES